MAGEVKEYNRIISLGGNCSAAIQLGIRGLRQEALPFDYFFLRNTQDFNKFLEALKNDFKYCFEKESLRELQPHERGGSDLYQYQDMVSGYNIIHVFNKPIEIEAQYQKFKSAIDRRLKRFFDICNNAKKICFIIKLGFDIDEKYAYELYDILKTKCRHEFDLIFITSSADEDKTIIKDNLTIIKAKRCMNIYDYQKTNYDWAFLDDFKITGTKKRAYYIKSDKIKYFKKRTKYFFKVIKFKRGIQFKISILKLRIDFTIRRKRK